MTSRRRPRADTRSVSRSRLGLGEPGYRLRPGRSGLDYVESVAELARQAGLFVRRLFTGSLRTDQTPYRWTMGCSGLLMVVPVPLIVLLVLLGGGPELLVCGGPFVLFGALLLLNLIFCWRDDLRHRQWQRQRAEHWRRSGAEDCAD